MDMTQAKIEQVSRSIELLHIHTVDDLCQKDGNVVKETVEQTTEADMTRANVRKGRWKSEENNELKEIVELMSGAISWKIVSEKMGGRRTAKQCRERWCNHLSGSINNAKLTEEEKQEIRLHRKKGYTYAKISAKLSRTPLQIKNFCYPGETRPRPKARRNKMAIESLLSSQGIHDHHANDKTAIGMLAEQRTHDDHVNDKMAIEGLLSDRKTDDHP
ncbi:8460_t:CDS:2 [Acaulospora morrowiae]|uniref:8460_t:CDS:1 n=1 Tax=Acaulospora morrowiae TaxID=94023 RepID=A0A9N8WDB8_9GLOM|nr:8460_t:CDS:2 [Acaulospora morrowiae]